MLPVLTRMRHATSHHRGLRALSWLLMFSMIWLAWPQLQVHAHDGSVQVHQHSTDAHAHSPRSAESDAGQLIHLHDSPALTFALLSPVNQVPDAPLSGWRMILEPAPSPVTASAPPHRPPII